MGEKAVKQNIMPMAKMEPRIGDVMFLLYIFVSLLMLVRSFDRFQRLLLVIGKPNKKMFRSCLLGVKDLFGKNNSINIWIHV